MSDVELTKRQRGLMGFFGLRRTDLHGGLTVAMIAEARDWDLAEAEETIQSLVDAAMLEPTAPGDHTHAPNGEPCYGPTEAGFAWLEERERQSTSDMVSQMQGLSPKGFR
jgi:hypothetical protein